MKSVEAGGPAPIRLPGEARFNADAFLFHLTWWLSGAKRPRRSREQRRADLRTRARVFAFMVDRLSAKLERGERLASRGRVRA